MVMNRSLLENPLPGAGRPLGKFEITDLHHHRQSLNNKNSADEGEHKLLFGQNGHSSQGSADG